MNKLIALFSFIKNRLSEPSTYASLAALSAIAGYKVDAGRVQDIMNIGTLIFGAVGVLAGEGSKTDAG